MLRIVLFFSFCLALPEIYAQKYTTSRTVTGKLQATFQKAVRMAFNGQTRTAIEGFEKAIQMDPLFIDAYIELANLNNQLGKYEQAEQNYKKAIAIDPNYEPALFYSLAIVQMDLKKWEQAISNFEAFIKNPGKGNEKRIAKAEKYLKNIRFASEAMQNPVPFQPVRLGHEINTPEAEYLPTISADGQTLFYTAVRGGQEDFYRSRKGIDGRWQKGEPITAINTPGNEGAQSISADEKLIVFTACNRRDGLGSCDIYFSELKKGQWTPVRNIGSPINSPAWESQAALSADGKTIIFASDRKGGFGGKDLWMSQRLSGGRWSEPTNLGTPINTSEDEQSPFLHPDGQSLYFMSNGHPGLGGFDLFLSRRKKDGNWSEPKNLGYPINTPANEGALSVSLDGKTAYFATDQLTVGEGASVFDNPQGKGTTDIYSFELYEAVRPMAVTYVKAIVTDADSGKPLSAKVEFLELPEGQLHATALTEDDGGFLVVLPAGKNYALEVSKEKYLFHSENFALNEINSVAEPFLLNIALLPLHSNANTPASKRPVVLKNVFFETGSAALKNESRIELLRLKKLLNENPDLKIQINGHTDNVGLEEANLRLSEERAKAVYDFLVGEGIAPQRLRYKGYGETLPVATNDTESGRQQNRRTEFEIIR